MNNVANMKGAELQELFNETGARMGMSPAIIEKDFWVCWVLGKIYSNDTLSSQLIFKGGTSLSKVYGLIERFSEDIDLILDWRLITEADPTTSLSRSAQDRLNKTINSEAREYIRCTLLPEVQQLLAPHCQVSIEQGDEAAQHVIEINYPMSAPLEYLRSSIRLEVGPLAAWLPQKQGKVTPYAAEIFPQLFLEPECEVKVIDAKRTFWEKATILHHEANRPQDNPVPKRYSRHYYDLYKMSKSNVKQEALNDLNLLKDVVEFKKKFYYRGWAQYDDACSGKIKLNPPTHVAMAMEKDYESMKEMMFGDIPAWSDIINALQQLEIEVNNLAP